ncbi:exonuclease, DNA polymerase III, epsilon subunit family domain protein [Mycobacterium xenopi 3993]|nr:exonuclease, DNA polymerase III, epsilon subunit family domain protein [Mycobacterium xenopi 3993]
MATIWGRPATEPGAGWAVVDVETSGFRPGPARIISLAVLALDADGRVEQSVVSLLNPGVDPGPTHVHGLTAAMLEDQPQFADIVDDVVKLLDGRTLVAHNVAFDYAFLAAEAEFADAELPVDTVMCTVELARRLDLGVDNLRLETLAAHWGVAQQRPHDAFDDALVLSRVLPAALERARQRDVWLPVRPVTRRRWPNGRVTHDELRPLKMLASRMPCPYLNPGRMFGPAAGPGHAGGVGRRMQSHPRRTGRADPARRAGLQRCGGPGHFAGGLQRSAPRTRQGLPGARTWRAGALRCGVPRPCTRSPRRHGHRGIQRPRPGRRAVRLVLTDVSSALRGSPPRRPREATRW